MKSVYMTHILFAAIDEIFNRCVLKEKKIILFGLNASAFAAKQYLQEKGIEVFAFVDNNSAALKVFNNPSVEPNFHHMIGEKRLVAYKPETLPSNFREEYVFLLYSKFEAEMIQQLKKMGYSEGKDIFVMGGFWKTEEIMKTVVYKDAGAILTWEQEKYRQIEALKYVFRICEENNLRCYLNYGTLIGAVRHRGYIPWDDDVDLSMPVCDMNKLLELIKQENGRYGVYYSAYDDPCRHFIAKIEDRETILHQWDIPIELLGGMVIDIFPLGGLPGDKKQAMEFYEEVMKHGWDYDNLVVEFPNANSEIIKLRNEQKKWVLDALVRYPFDEAKYVFTVADKPGIPRVFPKRIWDQRIPLNFEGENFWGPAGYDEYLNIHYGDYTLLPPENRRVSIHRNILFENLAYTNKRYISFSKEVKDVQCLEKIEYTPHLANKKRLTFYFSISEIYTYEELAITKLMKCLDNFLRKKDEIWIYWIIEDDFENIVKTICPLYYNRIMQNIENFIDLNLGEIVPMDEASKAIDCCDAYYGAGGYAMYLAQERKIPVMKSNIFV